MACYRMLYLVTSADELLFWCTRRTWQRAMFAIMSSDECTKNTTVKLVARCVAIIIYHPAHFISANAVMIIWCRLLNSQKNIRLVCMVSETSAITHTHTHIHTHTHTHTYTHTYVLTHTLLRTLTRRRTHTHTYALTLHSHHMHAYAQHECAQWSAHA